MVRMMWVKEPVPNPNDELCRKANELMELANPGTDSGDGLKHLSNGFRELSDLAMDCHKLRIACASKALSAIFTRIPEGNPEDLPFVLDTAVNFLATIQVKCRSGALV